MFEDDVPFPQLGYVNSLKGIVVISRNHSTFPAANQPISINIIRSMVGHDGTLQTYPPENKRLEAEYAIHFGQGKSPPTAF